MEVVDWLARFGRWGSKLHAGFWKSVGDIRDDIRDSWGCEGNAEQAEKVIGFLFGLQNDPAAPCSVVVLSGDIHTSGYATLYSSEPSHQKRSSIPHVTSSAVAYSPFNWLLEAVYRNATRSLPLGKTGRFSSQISHHFCSRGVAVLSLRPAPQDGGHQLKVRYYLEGYAEPQAILFDLAHSSHRENIAWAAQSKVSPEYAPLENQSVEQELEQRAQRSEQDSNWRESVVDTMKLLEMDSSFSARKRLAQQWGYEGPLDGSEEMNLWLRAELLKRIAPPGAAG